MNYRQFLTTKTNLPTELINKVLDFWIEYDPKIHTWSFSVMANDLDTIKLLHKYNVKGYSKHIMNIAIMNEYLDVVKFLSENKYYDYNCAYRLAYYNKNLEIFKYLMSIMP